MQLKTLAEGAVEKGASDLHLQVGAPPMLRIAGAIHAVQADPITSEELHAFLESISPHGRATEVPDIDDAARVGLDFSWDVNEQARFRCSAYKTRGRLSLVMRVIRTRIPSISDLKLPSVVFDIAMSGRGLTLVTGTTGSGKSTTLAAMIDLINTNEAEKIITVEDPIEYLHTNKKSLISQIELGSDTPSFDQALRQALRQDPDVILIGELRDVDTLRIALRAADTGHQVFATVHSARAAQTVERIIAMFPPAEHKLLLSQLAHSLTAIMSQKLVPLREGGRRQPAVEILRGGPVTEKYVMEGKLDELSAYLESGESGMQSFEQHLLQLYNERLITGTEAMKWANRPEALATAMRGIRYTAKK